jgi:low molecular weight phosphotyrosine protein phosphatase
MAEGIFRNLTRFGTKDQHPLIKHIDSCGTGAYHTGAQPDSRTLSVLESNGLTGYRHKARKVQLPDDFEEFDYILGMDDENVVDLKELVLRDVKRKAVDESVESKVQLYGVYGGKSKKEEVGDPYYGGRDGFVIAYEQLARFGKGLLKHIEEQGKS